MGRKFIDLTGERFGKLKVLSFAYKKGTRTYWKCKCDCGGERIVSNDHLKRGDVIDCGCYKKHISHSTKHGMCKTRIYRIWTLMKYRCFNPNRPEYKSYGGRGITVCDEWLDFAKFMKWSLENGYTDDLTLDRIDTNGNYCPENCRWTTNDVQANNKRTCRYITYNGQTKTITQWAKSNNLPYYILKKRIDLLGWSFERAISEPIHLNVSNKRKR